MSRNSDRFNAAGAERHAGIIREFWRSRGWLPNVWVQIPDADPDGSRTGVCVIRSDMKNGLPQEHSRMVPA